MNLIRVGRRILNLDYLIDSVSGEPAPDAVRLHLESGRSLDLAGIEAIEYTQQLAAIVIPISPRNTHGRRPIRRHDPE